MNEDDLRERFVEIAASFVGCGYATDAQRFMDLVAPGETSARQRSMASLSTCGLFVRGLLAASGATDARVVAPYHDGRVISDLAAMAREADALISFAEVQPADVLVLSAPEHVMVAESIDGDAVTSIDGGQKDERGAQTILRRSRKARAVGMKTLLDGRPVELAISIEVLLARFLP
jgi:hypothetical protein